MRTAAGIAALCLAAACRAGAGGGDDGASAGADLADARDVGDVPAADVPIDAADVRDAAPGDDGPVPDAVDDPGPPFQGCRSCEADGDCRDGYRCLPVGVTKHCLLTCTDDGDCPKSHLCYRASTAGSSCLPVSYNCVDCAFEAPCDAGRACDFITGTCKDGRGTCQPCTWDFDCRDDLRCLKDEGQPSGRCVPPCGKDGSCPAGQDFACAIGTNGVALCRPAGEGCGGCPAGRPYPSDDGTTCRQCLHDGHCDLAALQVCDLASGLCIVDPDGCGSGRKRCPNGLCQQCCEDADCPGGQGPCSAGQCSSACDCCVGQCADPFPVCAIVDNIAQCVQCLRDADCERLDPACHCGGDPAYACLKAEGSPCNEGDSCLAVCTSDADCPPTRDGTAMRCTEPGGGACFDPRGRCDAGGTCCAPGASCVAAGAVLADLGGPESLRGLASCTCDPGHPCLGGLPCHPVAGLCGLPGLGATLCPGDLPPAALPASLCTDLVAEIAAATAR